MLQAIFAMQEQVMLCDNHCCKTCLVDCFPNLSVTGDPFGITCHRLRLVLATSYHRLRLVLSFRTTPDFVQSLIFADPLHWDMMMRSMYTFNITGSMPLAPVATAVAASSPVAAVSAVATAAVASSAVASASVSGGSPAAEDGTASARAYMPLLCSVATAAVASSLGALALALGPGPGSPPAAERPDCAL